jgi:hypothetical protein
VRLGLCLPVVLLALAACGGGGEGNGDEDGLTLSPTSGEPGAAVTVTPPPCAEPPLVAEWISPSGFSSLVASTDAQSELGLTSVPGNATPGTYTVVVTCANNPQPVGEATFEVTAG